MTGGKSGLPGAVSDGQSLARQAIRCVTQRLVGWERRSGRGSYSSVDSRLRCWRATTMGRIP